jgi:methionine-S-sulfoxide reductase
VAKNEKAYFAGGCFWGVEYYFKKVKDVLSVTSGYCGGEKENPSYEDVCAHGTGYAETVEVEFNPSEIGFEDLVKTFFSIHDFTQVNGQGPDIGDQYRSEIFYVNDDQRKIAEKVIEELKGRGYNVATKVTKFKKFWPAEDYHQDYYKKNGGEPYCHFYRKIFKL